MARRKSHWPLTLLGGGVSILNMLLPLVLVRILTPTEIGQYKIYFLYLQLTPAFLLASGITNGLSHWGGNDAKRERAFRSSWAVLLILASAILGAGLLFNSELQSALGWNDTKTHLLTIGAFICILANFYDDASIASGHILRGALFTSGFDLLRNVAMAWAGWKYRAIEPVMWAHVSVLGTKLVLGTLLGFVEGFQRPTFNRETFKAVARYAFPVSISALLSTATAYADQLLLSKFLAPDEFAVYAFGCLIVPPLLIFEYSVARVLIPRMSRAFVGNRSASAMRMFHDAVSELSWLLFPAAIGLIIFAEPIVILLFTERFIAAALFLKVYALNHIINTLPHDSVARARADGRWILRRLTVFSGISLLFVFIMAKNYGAMGALIASVLSRFLMRSTAMVSIHQSEKWPLSKMLPLGDWGKYLATAALASLGAYAIRPLTGGGLHWLLLGGALFSIVYLFGTFSVFNSRRKQLDPLEQ